LPSVFSPLSIFETLRVEDISTLKVKGKATPKRAWMVEEYEV
jgi:hypothetical protein